MKSLILTLSLLTLVGCGAKQGAGVGDVNPCFITGSATTVYSYGDSITHGVSQANVGGSDCFNNYTLEFAVNNGYSLADHAIGGTDMTSANQSGTLLTQTWDAGSIVIFTPGVNDAAHYGHDATYMAWYETTLTQIVANMASQNVKAFIGTPNHVLAGAPENNSDIDGYAQINRNVVANANNPNIVLVDFNANYNPSSSTTVDDVHPNSVGFGMMTQILQAAQ